MNTTNNLKIKRLQSNRHFNKQQGDLFKSLNDYKCDIINNVKQQINEIFKQQTNLETNSSLLDDILNDIHRPNRDYDEIDYLNEEYLGLSPSDNEIDKNYILIQKLKSIIIKYNICDSATNEILEALNKYGVKISNTQDELFSTIIKRENNEETNLKENLEGNKLFRKSFSLEAEELEEIPKFNVETLLDDDFIDTTLLDLCLEKIAEMTVTVEELRVTQHKILSILKNQRILIKGKGFGHIKFPKTKYEEIVELNDKCDNDPEFVNNVINSVRCFKQHKVNSTAWSCYGLSKIMTDELIMVFNWDGNHGRKSFSQLKSLNDALFEAWKDDSMPIFLLYADHMKSQFHAARCRVAQRKMRRNKSNNTIINIF